MRSRIWASLAALALAFNSGCMLCQDCFDYAYPGHGGCRHWEVNDCCRAGSAFCHMGGEGFVPGGSTPAIHDSAPEPLPYDTPPAPGEVVPNVPEGQPAPPSDLTPPVDTPPSALAPPVDTPPPGLAPPGDTPPSIDDLPPSEIPNTDLPQFDNLDLPPLRDLDLPPLNEDGSLPSLGD